MGRKVLLSNGSERDSDIWLICLAVVGAWGLGPGAEGRARGRVGAQVGAESGSQPFMP